MAPDRGPAPPGAERLPSGLNLPHGLARGPDGAILVAEDLNGTVVQFARAN
ncbi:MAG: hypothetical protein AB1429_09720 [Pseudomonadota bacterium]